MRVHWPRIGTRSFDEAIFQSSRLRPVRPQHPECDIPTDPNRTSDHATLSRTLSGTGSEARDAVTVPTASVSTDKAPVHTTR